MPMTAYNQLKANSEIAAGGRALAEGLVRYVLALLYAFVLCYAYDVISKWWAYFGFTYMLDDEWMLYVACAAAAVPATLLPTRSTTFSQASAWFLYILVFMPCMLVTVMQFSGGSDGTLRVFSSVFGACILFVLIARGETRRWKVPEVPVQAFWLGVGGLWLLLMTLVLYTFRGSFQIVGADDIYNQRFVGAGVAGSPIVRYSIALLASAINPFLVGAGLYTGRYWISAIGVGSQFALFGTLAAKAVLLSPVFVIAVYFLGDRQGRMRGNLIFAGLLVLFVLTSPLLATYNPIGSDIDQVTTLLYMRTLLISGATFGVYEQFFAVYPLTYFSNNNIISWFVVYPYGEFSVGQTVQSWLIPTNAAEIGELNANFLATDGVAALGLWGVPIAAALCALVLRFMSKFLAADRTMLFVACGTGFLLSLANTSLLTSLVTGGGIVLTALLAIAPLRKR